jgi:hypothetical protein
LKVPSPQAERRNDSMPMGYAKRAALRREQCDGEGRKSGARRDGHYWAAASKHLSTATTAHAAVDKLMGHC